MQANAAAIARPARRTRAPAPLSALNRSAQARAFDLDRIDWSLNVDRAKPWEPGALGALGFLPSSASLSPAQRLRCNQLQALGRCEQFIWFETQLIRAVRRLRATGGLPDALDEALDHLATEETKHIAMFWRLLEKSEPRWYAQRRPRLARLAPHQRLVMNQITARPRTLLAWIWLTIFVEERALFLSLEHVRAAKAAPGRIDALHTQVHSFHLRDEARHCRLDRHLLAELYDPQPRWKKALAAAMLRPVMRAWVKAPRTSARVLAQLGREFPALRAGLLPRLYAELRAIGCRPDYHRRLFSHASMPRSLALLAEYREHDRLWDAFPIARSALP